MTNQVTEKQVRDAYALARERYAALGVDTDAALKKLAVIPISLHCWQGDDVGGFEAPGGPLGGGLAATGNYPGKARTAPELRQDLDVAYRLIPGNHRLNLHAIYAETGGKKSGARRAPARALRGLGCVGEGEGPRTRLQPDPVLASQSGERSHPGQLQ